MPSRKKKLKVITPVEKFAFEMINATLTHTISTPFIKLKNLLQLRNTIIEYDLSTNISQKCLQDPSLFTLCNHDNIHNLLSGNLYSIFRVFVNNLNNLAIKQPLIKRMTGIETDNTYSMLLTKKFIFGFIGNIISINFTYYLHALVLTNRVCITDNKCNLRLKSYKFGIFQSGFNTTIFKSCVFRILWFTSCYGIEPYIQSRFMKKIFRKTLTYALQYPLDTIRNRQILTGENAFISAENIYKTGWKSFFSGIIPKLCQEFIFVGIGMLMERVKYKFAEWKYNISWARKKRKGIINLKDLCLCRNSLLFRETLLVSGFIRMCAKMKCRIYVPKSIIDMIEKKFYHDTKYDILDRNVERFVNELCCLDCKDVMEIDRFGMREEFRDVLYNLLNERGFQNVWKCQMRKIVSRKIDLGDDINYLKYVWNSKDALEIVFSCDKCGYLMCEEKMYCAFWECGHVYCDSCDDTMLNDDSVCQICNIKCLKCYEHCIKLRDFNFLLI
eukprot:306252_1